LYNVVIPQDFFNERVNGMDLVNAKQSWLLIVEKA
jgi:hypothetical protein